MSSRQQEVSRGLPESVAHDSEVDLRNGGSASLPPAENLHAERLRNATAEPRLQLPPSSSLSTSELIEIARSNQGWSHRSFAVTWLGERNPEDRAVRNALTELIRNDPEVMIRAGAYEALGRLAERSQEPVRQQIIDVLKESRRAESDGLVRDVSERVLTGLGARPGEWEDAQELGNLVASSNPAIQRQALFQLRDARVVPQEAVGPLMQILERSIAMNNTVEANAAITALGKAGSQAAPAVALLVQGAERFDSWVVRQNVAEALGRIADNSEPAVSALVSIINRNEFQSTPAALAALRNLDERVARQALPAVLRVLRDEDSTVSNKVAAAEALAHFEPAHELVQALERELDHYHPKVAIAAAQALGQYGQQARETISKLVNMVEDRDETRTVRVAAAEALGRIINHQDQRAIEVLSRFTESPWEDLRAASTNAILQSGALSLYGHR